MVQGLGVGLAQAVQVLLGSQPPGPTSETSETVKRGLGSSEGSEAGRAPQQQQQQQQQEEAAPKATAAALVEVSAAGVDATKRKNAGPEAKQATWETHFGRKEGEDEDAWLERSDCLAL